MRFREGDLLLIGRVRQRWQILHLFDRIEPLATIVGPGLTIANVSLVQVEVFMRDGTVIHVPFGPHTHPPLLVGPEPHPRLILPN